MNGQKEKQSWRESGKIDPNFDEFIKVYLDFLTTCNLPKNKGYLDIEKKVLECFDLDELPRVDESLKEPPSLLSTISPIHGLGFPTKTRSISFLPSTMKTGLLYFTVSDRGKQGHLRQNISMLTGKQF